MSILHIPFYPSDWLAGTRGMSAEETGVYITLIARIYEMAGPIDRDDERLARLCGCKTKSRFQKALKYLTDEGKIIEVDGALTNFRAEKEIEKVIGKSDKAKQAAESRWNRKPNKNNDSSHANASPKHMPQRYQLEPEPELKKDDGDDSAREAETLDPESKHPTDRERLLKAMGHDPIDITANDRLVGTEIDMVQAKRWETLGLSVDQQIAVITEVMARKRDGPPNSFRYFNTAMERVAGALAEQPLQPSAPEPRAQPPTSRPAIDVAAILAQIPDQD